MNLLIDSVQLSFRSDFDHRIWIDRLIPIPKGDMLLPVWLFLPTRVLFVYNRSMMNRTRDGDWQCKCQLTVPLTRVTDRRGFKGKRKKKSLKLDCENDVRYHFEIINNKTKNPGARKISGRTVPVAICCRNNK